jgi:integrase
MGSERGAELWSVVTTGMGPKEYWGRWKELPDRVHIAGTKREGRIRDVPRIGRVVKPAVLYPAWRKALLLAATGERDPKVAAKHPDAVRMYDLRRTYATWMEAAGIPRTRRKLYMGHGAGDVTDLYERHQIEAFLAEDAAKLRHYLGEARGPGLRLEKAGAAG